VTAVVTEYGPRTWCTSDRLTVVEREDHRVILNEIWKELGEEEHGGRHQAYAVLFPEPRSDQGGDLQDLVAGAQGQVPEKEDPTSRDHHEPIGEVLLGPQGNRIAVVGAPPPSSMTWVPVGPRTRARDGPWMAA